MTDTKYSPGKMPPLILRDYQQDAINTLLVRGKKDRANPLSDFVPNTCNLTEPVAVILNNEANEKGVV